jgi:hypothetical protein
MSRRLLIVLVACAGGAVVLRIAGVLTWRMSSPQLGPEYLRPYRLHPLRAELLWAAACLFALVAVAIGVRERRVQSVSRQP